MSMMNCFSYNAGTQNNISQDESAMNFSFSEVKASVDKSAFFDRNMMVLHTDFPKTYEMLEQVSQEEDSDEECNNIADSQVVV